MSSHVIQLDGASSETGPQHSDRPPPGAVTCGQEPVAGKVKLDLPEIAENGNTVPLSVVVESPMTEQSYVQQVLVVADGNPNAGVATFNFTALSGAAEATTRIRLATTQ